MFHNCPVRRSCNKLGALILRKYGTLPAEAKEVQRVRVVMALDFELSSGVACALKISSHQMPQLFVGMITRRSCL